MEICSVDFSKVMVGGGRVVVGILLNFDYSNSIRVLGLMVYSCCSLILNYIGFGFSSVFGLSGVLEDDSRFRKV